jgi:hypothetical protein
VDGLRTAEDSEEAAQERDRRARSCTQARVGDAGHDEQPEWDQTADEVVTGRSAGVRLQEVVVDDMQGDDC